MIRRAIPVSRLLVRIFDCLSRLDTTYVGNFIVERPEDDSLVATTKAKEELPKPWTLFMDGSSCIDGSRAGLILTNLEGIEFTYALRFRFDATNNEAEYEALIAGLRSQSKWVYRPVPRNPQQKLTPIMSPWPFYKWGIDIARPFPKGPGKVKFLIVAIDYFTKWIEGKPVTTITGTIHSKIGVKSCASISALPPSSIHKPMACNGDTQFSLTYGTEAIISAEIGMPTSRTAEIEMAQNDEALEINIDLLEERREQAAIHKARSKEKMEKYYNSKVRNKSFKLGDLVYRNNDASHARDSRKLGPKWEGPYEVTEALGKGAYKLRDRDGKLLPRTWNVRNLKKCYVHEI
ncbi:reverse transcriptase domain-containing protein [Tanacetum coccineum]